jgi:hypothetical protein
MGRHMLDISFFRENFDNFRQFFYSHYDALSWVSVPASVLAVLISSIGVWITLRNFRHQLRSQHYTEVDRMYFDILKMTMDSPHLRNPALIPDADAKKQHEYDVYAFLVWNFIETIYDKCQSDNTLKETWDCIIIAEGRLHKEWFLRPENRPKFKERFHKYILRRKELVS